MLKCCVGGAELLMLVVVHATFTLPAEAAQAVGGFNIKVNVQPATVRSGAGAEQLVPGSVAALGGASQSANNYVQIFSANDTQFAAGSKALDGSWLWGAMGIRRSLGVMTYWHMVNILGSGDDPDRSYLEMLIGW